MSTKTKAKAEATTHTATIDTAALKTAITTCARAADHSHYQLGHIHIHIDSTTATVTAGDGDTTTQLTVPIESRKDDTGIEITTVGYLLRDIASRAPGDWTTLEVTGNRLTARSGRWQATIPTTDPIDYRAWLPQDIPTHPATVDAATLTGAIRQVAFAASDNPSRRELSGVRVQPSDSGGLHLVATDSYRLACRHIDTDIIDTAATIPAAALQQVAAIGGAGDQLDLWVTDRLVRIRAASTTITTRLIEGPWPDWRHLIPRTRTGTAVIDDPVAFTAAVTRVGRDFGGDRKLVSVHLHPDHATLTATATDIGESIEDADLEWDGPEMTVAFNTTFLAEGLRSITGPIQIAVIDHLKPVVMRSADNPDDSDDLHLLMPIRVD